MNSRFRTNLGPALALPALLVVALAAPVCAGAQVNRTVQPVQSPQAAPLSSEAGSELSRNLNILANNPNSVAALTGAGRAALELDDPQAALTFFGRAEELEPQDGRIKANIGTALVLMDQAEPSLSFFEEAVRLGAPEADLAGDRGLAFDLTGNPQRAQRDYQMALRRKENPEIRRRLALSLGISGQRNAALAAIDDQLRRQDRAAWRVRAFILALTGDLEGADEVVRSVMPAQAAAMAPFLGRLASLSPAERARAVHLGLFPGEATMAAPAIALATPPPRPPVPDSVISAGRPDPNQRPLGLLPPPAAVPPRGFTPLTPKPSSPPAPASASRSAPPPASAFVQRPIAPAVPSAPADRPAPPARSTARPSGLSDLAASIATLRDPPAAPPAKTPAVKPSAAKPPVSRAAAAQAAQEAKEPSRSWVQLAHASSAAPLGKSYRQIRAKATKLFAGKDAWTATQKTTARLLVGPFKSSREAEEFVERLEKADVLALAWTSPAGQEVTKLSD